MFESSEFAVAYHVYLKHEVLPGWRWRPRLFWKTTQKGSSVFLAHNHGRVSCLHACAISPLHFFNKILILAPFAFCFGLLSRPTHRTKGAKGGAKGGRGRGRGHITQSARYARSVSHMDGAAEVVVVACAVC